MATVVEHDKRKQEIKGDAAETHQGTDNNCKNNPFNAYG